MTTRPASRHPPASPTPSRTIALGALDGRYRGVVAPLVDHLSEPALNRERVHVEVEWLIHLTEHEVVPGVRRLTTGEQEALRDVVRGFGAAEIDGAGRHRAGHRARRQGRRVLPQEAARRDRARRAGRRARRADPLRVHQRGRQQPLVRRDGQGRRQRGVAAPRDRARRRGSPTMASRPARRAAARAHPRPARDPDHDGQGARRARARLQRQLRPHRGRRVPRQAQRRHRHLRRARRRRAGRRLAGRQPRRSSSTSASPGTR